MGRLSDAAKVKYDAFKALDNRAQEKKDTIMTGCLFIGAPDYKKKEYVEFDSYAFEKTDVIKVHVETYLFKKYIQDRVVVSDKTKQPAPPGSRFLFICNFSPCKQCCAEGIREIVGTYPDKNYEFVFRYFKTYSKENRPNTEYDYLFESEDHAKRAYQLVAGLINKEEMDKSTAIDNSILSSKYKIDAYQKSTCVGLNGKIKNTPLVIIAPYGQKNGYRRELVNIDRLDGEKRNRNDIEQIFAKNMEFDDNQFDGYDPGSHWSSDEEGTETKRSKNSNNNNNNNDSVIDGKAELN